MKIIPVKLPNKKASVPCYVDDEDYERIAFRKDGKGLYKWKLHMHGYACRNGGRGSSSAVYLHREIMKPDKGFLVDHINRNKLDNRRQNLRLATPSQNQSNRKVCAGHSKFRGVVFEKKSKRNPWMARIQYEHKIYHIGMFKTKEDAARAYDEKAKEVHGEFAQLNYPENNN